MTKDEKPKTKTKRKPNSYMIFVRRCARRLQRRTLTSHLPKLVKN